MAHATLTPDVTSVLERSEIIGNILKLPPEQLERKLYESVNKALANAGGKWNRSAQGFVFPKSPADALGIMLETGVSRSKKKDNQAFYTPEALAARVAELAEIRGHVVLEPSAGHGALALAALEAGASLVDCVELDSDSCEVLRNLPCSLQVRFGDFLTIPPIEKFDRIVMNPPFTRRQDVKHLAHALEMLAEDGVLVAILSSTADYQPLVEGRSHEVHQVPAGAFKESGTNVATIIVKVHA
jgi:predicted RNA methylase